MNLGRDSANGVEEEKEEETEPSGGLCTGPSVKEPRPHQSENRSSRKGQRKRWEGCRETRREGKWEEPDEGGSEGFKKVQPTVKFP